MGIAFCAGPVFVQVLLTHDRQREGVVVLLGSLAKHLDKEDPKVSSITQTLLTALSTPSEAVQRYVDPESSVPMKTDNQEEINTDAVLGGVEERLRIVYFC